MKASVFYAMAAAKLAVAHTTFQSFVLDGKDQGQHFAVQTPSNGNNPILDVTSTAMNCNGGKATADQVSVAAGGKITMQWHHNDPMTTSGDADEPIAASHKGPCMVYIAPADSNGVGAVWQKIFEDGFAGGEWCVQKFIANKGAIEITLPNLAPGNYLIRPEIIALHEASAVGKAQFYNGCGQIKVTGSGTLALPAAGTDMTKAYSATDPGVKFDIYNSFTSYPIPGPKVWTGAASSDAAPAPAPAPAQPATPSASAPAAPADPAPTPSAAPANPAPAPPAASTPPTYSALPSTLSTATKPAATPATGAGSVALYGQCGGQGFTGSTACAKGSCKVQNPYYSQCLE